jgi:hypothetical protein
MGKRCVAAVPNPLAIAAIKLSRERTLPVVMDSTHPTVAAIADHQRKVFSLAR